MFSTRSILVIGLAVVLTACGGGGTTTTATGGATVASVDQSSLHITNEAASQIGDSSGAIVSIPARSLMTTGANISITSLPMASGQVPLTTLSSATPLSRKYTLSQDTGFNFLQPVTVTLPYEKTGLVAADKIVAAYLDERTGKWTPLSDGVDDRLNGKFTFQTIHFSFWALFNTKSPSIPSHFDTGFRVESDGIPFTNLGQAITPDGNTSNFYGNCLGMSGMAGWYYSNKKNSSGSAVNQFKESSQARELMALIQSNANHFPGNYNYPVTSAASSEIIRSALFNNNAPLLVGVTDNFGGHALLIYSYDENGDFHYYDPNVSGGQVFNTNAKGELVSWKYSPSNGLVTSFKILGNLDALIGDKAEQYYTEYLASRSFSNDIFGSLGSFSPITTNITTGLDGTSALNINFDAKINTSVNGVEPLKGRELYVYISAPKQFFKNCSSPECYFRFGSSSYGSTVVNAGVTSFNGATAAGYFIPDIDVRATIYAVTDPAGGGLWAYKEFTFHTPPVPTSVPVCTSPQVLQNGLCIDAPVPSTPRITAIAPTIATTSTVTPFTVTGQNLPLTAVMELAEGICQTPTARTATSFSVVCTPGSTAGSKSITIKSDTVANNGTVIDATKIITVSATPLPLISQTITFNTPPNVIIGGPPSSFEATSSSYLPITYTSSTTSVCTINGTVMTLVAVGVCTVNADQAGNSVYAPAPRVTRSFSVLAGTPDLTPTQAYLLPQFFPWTQFVYRITVSNLGVGASNPSTVGFRFYNSSGIQTAYLEASIPAIAGNDILTFDFGFDMSTAARGAYTMVLKVDSNTTAGQNSGDLANDYYPTIGFNY